MKICSNCYYGITHHKPDGEEDPSLIFCFNENTGEEERLKQPTDTCVHHVENFDGILRDAKSSDFNFGLDKE